MLDDFNSDVEIVLDEFSSTKMEVDYDNQPDFAETNLTDEQIAEINIVSLLEQITVEGLNMDKLQLTKLLINCIQYLRKYPFPNIEDCNKTEMITILITFLNSEHSNIICLTLLLFQTFIQNIDDQKIDIITKIFSNNLFYLHIIQIIQEELTKRQENKQFSNNIYYSLSVLTDLMRVLPNIDHNIQALDLLQIHFQLFENSLLTSKEITVANKFYVVIKQLFLNDSTKYIFLTHITKLCLSNSPTLTFESLKCIKYLLASNIDHESILTHELAENLNILQYLINVQSQNNTQFNLVIISIIRTLITYFTDILSNFPFDINLSLFQYLKSDKQQISKFAFKNLEQMIKSKREIEFFVQNGLLDVFPTLSEYISYTEKIIILKLLIRIYGEFGKNISQRISPEYTTSYVIQFVIFMLSADDYSVAEKCLSLLILLFRKDEQNQGFYQQYFIDNGGLDALIEKSETLIEPQQRQRIDTFIRVVMKIDLE